MTKNEFLLNMQEIIQTENELSYETDLESLEEWDSLAKMALIAFFNSELKIPISFDDVKQMKTIKDIAKKACI